MKLTDNQKKFILDEPNRIDDILQYEPSRGDLNLKLVRQWWGMLLILDAKQ